MELVTDRRLLAYELVLCRAPRGRTRVLSCPEDPIASPSPPSLSRTGGGHSKSREHEPSMHDDRYSRPCLSLGYKHHVHGTHSRISPRIPTECESFNCVYSMPQLWLFVLSAAVSVWLLRYWRTSRRRLPLPPGPRPLPIIGNVLDMPGKNSGAEYRELSDKYGTSSATHVSFYWTLTWLS